MSAPRCSVLCWLLLVSIFAIRSQGAEPPENLPIVEQILPAPGETVAELLTVEVRFDRAVDGVEARDLLVNGVAATEVEEVADGQFVFTISAPAAGVVAVEWQAN